MELTCDSGTTHPETRYHVTQIRCVNGSSDVAEWFPAVPSRCVPVDCGEPPLGVHARPPLVS